MSAKEQLYVSPAADYAAELDRCWFLAHPRAQSRIRPIIKGEFPDLTAAGCDLVIVWQMRPGLRGRMPFRPARPGEEPYVVAIDPEAEGA